MKSYLQTIVAVIFAMGVALCLYWFLGSPRSTYDQGFGRNLFQVHTVDGSATKGIVFWLFEFGDLLLAFAFGLCLSSWLIATISQSGRIVKYARYVMFVIAGTFCAVAIFWLASNAYIMDSAILRVDDGARTVLVEIDPRLMVPAVSFVLCLGLAPVLASIGFFMSSRHDRFAGPDVRRVA
ncbi:MAG: hypothetical protein ACK5WB_08785 [Phycisphaerales bacterium]|jgi:hypothetical protein